MKTVLNIKESDLKKLKSIKIIRKTKPKQIIRKPKKALT